MDVPAPPIGIACHPYQEPGVATALIQHLLALPGYEEYVLRDIKDTNTPALKLYAKLGFTEYESRSVRFATTRRFLDLRLAETHADHLTETSGCQRGSENDTGSSNMNCVR